MSTAGNPCVIRRNLFRLPADFDGPSDKNEPRRAVVVSGGIRHLRAFKFAAVRL